MKKKLLSFLLVVMLIGSLSATAFAQSYAYSGDVTFTANGTMEEYNFNPNQVFNGLEPGDDATYTVSVHNRNSQPTRWYMLNDILKTLEENERNQRINGIENGAYSYVLTYTGPKGGSQTLYNSNDRSISDYVGGGGQSGSSTNSGAPVGLHEATSNLENYFFLDTLNNGESGVVRLRVALEGETQDNTYQNTDAQLRMRFAVELTNPNGSRTSVKTGDENNLMPYYIGMVIAGLVLLFLALDAYTDRKYKKGKG